MNWCVKVLNNSCILLHQVPCTTRRRWRIHHNVWSLLSVWMTPPRGTVWTYFCMSDTTKVHCLHLPCTKRGRWRSHHTTWSLLFIWGTPSCNCKIKEKMWLWYSISDTTIVHCLHGLMNNSSHCMVSAFCISDTTMGDCLYLPCRVEMRWRAYHTVSSVPSALFIAPMEHCLLLNYIFLYLFCSFTKINHVFPTRPGL